MADATRLTPVQVLCMFAAIAVTLAIGGMIIRTTIERGYKYTLPERPPREVPALGVHATITAGDVMVERTWSALEIELVADQPIDEALPDSPFAGDFVLTFNPGSRRQAHVGAWIQNGSLIIMRDDEVLLSDYAGLEPKLVLTRLPVWLPRRYERIQFHFQTDGVGPVKLQAMWRPEGTSTARPLR